MADEAGQKAMLYFLEILMNNNSPFTISQLAGHFGNRGFTSEMRQAAGGNEANLKKFLLKYPSLFTVSGNMVRLNDGTAPMASEGFVRENSPASSSPSLPDVSMETEAVNYFRARLLKKKESQMLVRSLAGHLSQAPLAIREVVGPQNMFEEWIRKHPLIFEIKGDVVSVKNNYPSFMRADSATETESDSKLLLNSSFPQTPKEQRKRPHSLHGLSSDSTPPMISTPVTPLSRLPSVPPQRPGPITMTANEYKGVMYFKSVIEKRETIKVANLASCFTQAPESLKTTIGYSKHDVERFLREHLNIFVIDGDDVMLRKNTRLNVIITGSRPSQVDASVLPATINNRKGKVYHVSKLWAIIDLGKHEHVFIDKQILGRQIDDLNKVLKVADTVCFNATAAQKGSRAKWRATKVWKENESIEDLIERISLTLDINLDNPSYEVTTPISLDEEIKKIIPELDSNFSQTSTVNVGGVKYAFNDAAPSAAGVVPVWNFKHIELEGMKDVDDLDLDDSFDTDSLANVSIVGERHFMNCSVLDDSPKHQRSRTNSNEVNGYVSSPSLTNGHSFESLNSSSPDLSIQSEKKFGVKSPQHRPSKSTHSVSCQTIVTGEVLATQLFHEYL